ncbi:MAG: energy-coupled thiamine transporter ThiT [Fretibacterium sp.]|nr:energy-coupled thiamine transporter ThiT [Fretibacterium sp.]
MPDSSRSKITAMVEGALCIALGEVLSKFNLFVMPQGSSVDMGLMPLILFAWFRGLKWGCGAGALAGLIKILLGGYILNPVQAVLDYPLAYACTGLAALLPRSVLGKTAGTFLAGLAQIACHVVSGAVFFGQYAPEGQNPWMYSFAYNAPVIAMKYVLSFIAVCILWKALQGTPLQKD